MATIGERLSHLGDPSGRQDAEYWDSWFDIVCVEQGHRPFEWYCGCNEVVRVLLGHIRDTSSIANPKRKRMIHPGSGTSLLPIVLRDKFENSEQVVVDVSEKAIAEMQKVHDTSQQRQGSIKCALADALRPPMQQFEDASFDCWIDKGFVDAVFSEEDNTQQARSLFKEAHRLLVPGTGFVLIVTLAEEHSVHTILDAVVMDPEQSWQTSLHVWEMEPVSGDMRPFGFVFFSPESSKKGAHVEVGERNMQIVWHDTKGEEVFTVARHDAEEKLLKLIALSRAAFVESPRRDAAGSEERLVLAVVEVKPSDTDVDLERVSDRIRRLASMEHPSEGRGVPIAWKPFPQKQDEDERFHEIVPIGFGVSKLLLRCVVASDCIDSLVTLVLENDTDDNIQSVDVDWEQTVPLVGSSFQGKQQL